MKTKIWKTKVLGSDYTLTATIGKGGKTHIDVKKTSGPDIKSAEEKRAVRRGLDAFCRVKLQSLFPTKEIVRSR